MSILSNISISRAMPSMSPGLTSGTGARPSAGVMAPSPLDNLDKELKKLEEKYSLYGKNAYNLPDKLDVSEMEYNGMSEDQINESAKTKLAADYAAALRLINDGAERSKQDLAGYKDKLNAAANDTLAAVDEAYKQASDAAGNDALKRGLARSSIIVNKLAQLEGQKSAAKTDVAGQLFKNLADIDDGLDTLESKRLLAIGELDIANAAKLAQEIRDLTEKREQKLDEILKYNNSLKEKQGDYALNYAKTDSALDSDAYGRIADDVKNGLSVQLNAQIQQEKFDRIGGFLNGLAKQDALDYLKNNEEYFTRQVGVNYYKKLLSDQQSR